MHNFRRLEVWRRAKRLAIEIERVAQSFPRTELSDARHQLARSAFSIPDNIAEACGKRSNRETLRFLDMAAASGAEAHNQLLQADERGFLPGEDRAYLLDEIQAVRNMLFRFMQRLESDDSG